MSELDLSQYPVQCSKCGRKILVSILRVGVSHDANILAMCADCIDWNVDYCKENPEYCKDIQEKFAAMPDRPEQ